MDGNLPGELERVLTGFEDSVAPMRTRLARVREELARAELADRRSDEDEPPHDTVIVESGW